MVPSRFSDTSAGAGLKFNGDSSTAGMVLIKGGAFLIGGDNSQADKDKYPKHKVAVSSFWMDASEVTNGEF